MLKKPPVRVSTGGGRVLPNHSITMAKGIRLEWQHQAEGRGHSEGRFQRDLEGFDDGVGEAGRRRINNERAVYTRVMPGTTMELA